MARFGIDSSSDEESISSHSSSSHSNKRRSSSEASQDGPPRESLMEQDSESESESEEELNSSRNQSKSLRTNSGSSSDASTSRSISPPRRDPIRARPIQKIPTRPKKNEDVIPWPKTLGLEPKRVAVMQASFFHQSTPIIEKQKRPLPVETLNKSRIDASFEPTRSTFIAPIVEPGPAPPFRKYGRVELDASVSNAKEGYFADSGLALGRSYKVGWGPENQLVHIGSLYGSEKAQTSETVVIDKLRTNPEPSEKELEIMIKTLQLQLDHTPIHIDTTSIPYPIPHSEFRFSHFCATLSPTDGSPEASLWKLGHALFDELEEFPVPEELESQALEHIVESRRRDRLEKWLETVVKGDIEENLRNIANENGGKDSGAKRVFALLSGHQLERACNAALDANDIRLATLVAQAGGDDDYREDIYLQLAKWREYRVDAHISNDYRKVYELLCGNVGLSEGLNKGDKVDGVDTVHMSEGLDWKRAFGIQLWYGTFQSTVATSVQRYEAASKSDNLVASPLPLYLERPSSTSTAITWKQTTESPSDPLYELIKIYTDSTHPLESALLPRNFGPSPLGYRLPWHLYILFSRVLRRRDFEDRIEMGEIGVNGLEGNSPRADMVTESYATQLESVGLWTWAAFVLLHLELPEKRVSAICALLARNVKLIDDESHDFLVETLKIPATWVYSAQAVAAKYNEDVFLEYQLLLAAKRLDAAHSIVIHELAPEAISRNDLAMIGQLLEPFDPRLVADWSIGGKIYLDYVDCVNEVKNPTGNRLDRILLKTIQSVPLLAGRSGLSDRGGLKLRVAISEMQSRLVAISTSLGKHMSAIRTSQVKESDRLVLLQGINTAFLTASLGVAGAV